LVRVPSRGGIDSYGPVLEHGAWLGEHDLPCRRLEGPGGGTVALMCEMSGSRPGRRPPILPGKQWITGPAPEVHTANPQFQNSAGQYRHRQRRIYRRAGM
jgi:hypothetical protein